MFVFELSLSNSSFFLTPACICLRISFLLKISSLRRFCSSILRRYCRVSSSSLGSCSNKKKADKLFVTFISSPQKGLKERKDIWTLKATKNWKPNILNFINLVCAVKNLMGSFPLHVSSNVLASLIAYRKINTSSFFTRILPSLGKK